VVASRQEVLERIEDAVSGLRQALGYRLAEAGRQLHARGIDRASGLLHRRIGRRLQRIDELDYALRVSVRGSLEERRARARALDVRLSALDLRLRLARTRRRLEMAETAAWQSAGGRLARARAQFQTLAAQLDPLSPLRVLDRGYAIATDEAGRVLKDASEVAPESGIRVRLARGRLRARVTEAERR
jgi:exodeoxyribonuclease VII large subunit